MYVNKCIKCGAEFETKNPKRVICPNCLYAEKGSESTESKPMQNYSSYSSYSAEPREQRSYQRPQNDGYRNNYREGGYQRRDDNGYQRRDNGGYNRDNRQGGYQRDEADIIKTGVRADSEIIMHPSRAAADLSRDVLSRIKDRINSQDRYLCLRSN